MIHDCPVERSLHVDMQQFRNPESSWPDLIRPSTPWGAAEEGVDARIKSGHDDLRWSCGESRLVISVPKSKSDSRGLDPGIHTFLTPDSHWLVPAIEQ
jgi:hypothetical protein